MGTKVNLLALILTGLQVLAMTGGQVLWKKGIDQAGGFLLPGQSVYSSLLHLVVNPAFLTGSALYIVATLLWFYLLARFELSYIYPFLSLTLIVSLLGARFLLGEPISMQRWIAVGFISLGVFLLTQS